MEEVVIIIPSRIGSSRFPRKPLANILGLPMVLQVLDRAKESGIGSDIFVATDDIEIFNIVESNGGKAVMTDSNLPSGTDRIYQAYKKIGKKYKYIINLQGDMPDASPEILKQCLGTLVSTKCDISTVVSKTSDPVDFTNENNVKVAMNKDGNALYFSRSLIPNGASEFYHHVGIYGYTNESLERFVGLEQSNLEKTERLEQLRALENGMSIYCSVTDEQPTGVDTPEDITVAEKKLSAKINQ